MNFSRLPLFIRDKVDSRDSFTIALRLDAGGHLQSGYAILEIYFAELSLLEVIGQSDVKNRTCADGVDAILQPKKPPPESASHLPFSDRSLRRPAIFRSP